MDSEGSQQGGAQRGGAQQGDAQEGSIDDPTLLGLNREGIIDARTLVWRDGLEEWASFASVAAPLFGTDEEGSPVEIGVCAYSNQVYPIDEMVPYGEALIGIEKKRPFVQRLMESGVVSLVDATETHMVYVGFWWRCLSSLLDYLIKMVPSWLCMVPFLIVTMVGGASIENTSEQVIPGYTASMFVAYGAGLLGMLGVSIFYSTWTVGKYQGTPGKLIIGAKVVNPDGSRLTYKRAFLRWLAKKPLNYLIIWLPATIGLGAIIGLIGAMAGQRDSPTTFAMALMSGMFVYVALLALFSGVYWMAAFDPEKRALHDRLVSTRVVKK